MSTNLRAADYQEPADDEVVSTESYAQVGEELYQVDATALIAALETFQKAWVAKHGRLLSAEEKEEVLRECGQA